MRVVIAGTKRSRRQERSLLWENGRQRKGSRAFRLIPIIAPLLLWRRGDFVCGEAFLSSGKGGRYDNGEDLIAAVMR